MFNNTRILSLFLCVYGLSSCTTDTPEYYNNYQANNYDGTQLYPEGYEGSAYPSGTVEKKPVAIPESYHVGAYHSPVPHTDRDKQWVSGQNPQGYTIELADGDKASQVANTLYNAPKNERMAEIKYQHEGKTYYKGLYGSYPNYEAAQQALKALPQDMQQKAGIKSWGTVQHGVGE